ncbi:MAG: HAD-IA family hydrolase, partial [Pseudarcicella sp.]|nr:HAD-IA family hydrolase [Pseudarcicella sp.]
AKYNLHILSNGFHHIQIKKMQSAGILNYFDKVITNEKANALKPDPLIFEFALNDTGALKSNSVMVGDNYFADIKGALNVGIPFLHLTNSDQDFEYSNKGFGISCLSQLKMYL